MTDKRIDYRWVLALLLGFFTFTEMRLLNMEASYHTSIGYIVDSINSGKGSRVVLDGYISIYNEVIDDINVTTAYLVVLALIFATVIVVPRILRKN